MIDEAQLNRAVTSRLKGETLRNADKNVRPYVIEKFTELQEKFNITDGGFWEGITKTGHLILSHLNNSRTQAHLTKTDLNQIQRAYPLVNWHTCQLQFCYLARPGPTASWVQPSMTYLGCSIMMFGITSNTNIARDIIYSRKEGSTIGKMRVTVKVGNDPQRPMTYIKSLANNKHFNGFY